MMRRSFFLAAALALAACMAFEAPANAAPMYLITVTEGIRVTENDGGQNITGVALTFSGVNKTTSSTTIGPIMNATSNAGGTYATFPPLNFHTEEPGVSVSGNTISLSYTPNPVYSLGGSVMFQVESSTENISTLASIIKLMGVVVTPGPNSNYTITTTGPAFTIAPVPEPSSMALLGIGMTSFLAFRRFFKRTPLA